MAYSKQIMILRTALWLFASLAIAQQVPRDAEDLTITYPDGQTKQLADYRGKVVPVAFISVTCPHCQHTTEILTHLQNELGPRGLQVLEVALDPDAKTTVPGFISQFRPSFPIGFTADYPSVARFLQLPNTQRPLYPLFAVVDRKGVIQFEATGRDDILANEANQEAKLRTELLRILKESGHQHAAAKTKTGS